MNVKILKATPKEFPLIRSINYTTWPVTYKKLIRPEQMEYMLPMMCEVEVIEKQFKEQGHIFLLAQIEENCLGYASYELNHKKSNSTKLHKIYILPEAQGKGVGKALLNEVTRAALQAHQKSILLNVKRDNPAIDFYKHYGFKIVAEEDIPIGNGFFMNDYVMEFILPIEKRL